MLVHAQEALRASFNADAKLLGDDPSLGSGNSVLTGNSDPKSQNREHIDAIIHRAAGALGLDPALLQAVVKAESNYNPTAVSHVGAKGLMQLMPKTAKEMGVNDPFDPLENIWGGARYLKKMLDSHGGNLNQALAAYNWGPGNLAKHGAGGNLPRETRRYIDTVNRNYDYYKKQNPIQA
ncbi:MAG: lytic transglycosylase domain-containing protein [Deltaproteobacteria bacterium]|jgi:soluble lytic murein transglycosylase-like protein|nr:lytic transglycosylase domain-containing protein [Deltaproteobacteria bacterium]